MTSDDDRDDAIVVKIVTIATLGIVVLAAIAGLTIVALFTERDLERATLLTAGITVLLGTIGGVSLITLHRRRHWKVNVEREEDK